MRSTRLDATLRIIFLAEHEEEDGNGRSVRKAALYWPCDDRDKAHCRLFSWPILGHRDCHRII